MNSTISTDMLRDLALATSEAEPTLSAQQMVELTQHALAVMEEQLNHIHYLNILQAKDLCSLYWSHTLEGQKTHQQSARLGSRVRVLKNTLSISWFFSSFTLKKGEHKGRFIAHHISKPRHRTAYTTASLSRCHPWERDNVLLTEAEYAKLRERQLRITEIRALIKSLGKLTSELN